MGAIILKPDRGPGCQECGAPLGHPLTQTFTRCGCSGSTQPDKGRGHWVVHCPECKHQVVLGHVDAP